jgi:hypothetical protein
MTKGAANLRPRYNIAPTTTIDVAPGRAGARGTSQSPAAGVWCRSFCCCDQLPL